MIIAFLEKKLDFKAFDREKAEVIFLTLPANEVEEAILDTRLRRLLMQPEFLAAIIKQPSRRELIELIAETEKRLLPAFSGKHADHAETVTSSGKDSE